MNCRFCGNFVPEGKDSCPVCGRRPDEEPIGKLLSENQPVTTMQTVEPAQAPEAPAAKKRPTGLLLPLLMIAVSVAGWFYGISTGLHEQFAAHYAVVSGNGTHTSDEYVTFDTTGDLIGMLIIGGLAILLTIIGIAGIVTLFKRLYNRIKY